MLKEYGPEVKYIKGPDNDSAGALSRLPLMNYDVIERKITREHLAERYCVDKLDSDTLSLIYQSIDKCQRKDKILEEKLKRASYHTKCF